MKKIPYVYIWFTLVLVSTTNLLAQKKRYQWVDPSLTTISIGPGDVAQKQLIRSVSLQGKRKISLSYIERLKAALKRLRDCLYDKDCSEEERIEAVDLANNLLDLILLGAGVGIVEVGEFIEKKK